MYSVRFTRRCCRRIYALTARGEACSVPLVCARDAPAAEKPGLLERLLGFLGRPIYLTGE